MVDKVPETSAFTMLMLTRPRKEQLERIGDFPPCNLLKNHKPKWSFRDASASPFVPQNKGFLHMTEELYLKQKVSCYLRRIMIIKLESIRHFVPLKTDVTVFWCRNADQKDAIQPRFTSFKMYQMQVCPTEGFQFDSLASGNCKANHNGLNKRTSKWLMVGSLGRNFNYWWPPLALFPSATLGV